MDELLIWVIGQIVVGAAIYGGIRADIKSIHKDIDHLDKSVADAHNRINRILEQRRT